jgi:RNA polymerase sigma-70 factor (ECF subfamily)
VRIKIFNNLRRASKIDYLSEDYQNSEFRLNYSTDADPEEKELNLDRLAEAINRLPPRQKETIYLKFYKNLSNTEVAEIMGVHPQSVSNHVQKAIHKLKVSLDSASELIMMFFQTRIR